MQQPSPKIYHIVHYDRLPSILAEGCLHSDYTIRQRQNWCGSNIGMSSIKDRRLHISLEQHPGLCIGHCVPFYFCPRSVMLYVIHRGNHEELSYRDGQEPVVHLQADLHQVVEWATHQQRRWVFTSTNASFSHCHDFKDLDRLDEIDWDAVNMRDWRDPLVKEAKQAEFLVEAYFPFQLFEHIAVCTPQTQQRVQRMLQQSKYNYLTPHIIPSWYY